MDHLSDVEMRRRQKQLLSSLQTELRSRDEVKIAILIGSLQSESPDPLSDIDILLYVTGAPWTRSALQDCLGRAGVEVDQHYWTGLEKHRLIAGGMRLDVSIRSHRSAVEMRFWPQLFFDRSSVLVDRDGHMASVFDSQSTKPPLERDEANDFAAYVTSLFNVCVQFIRGEYVNARNRCTGLVEAKCRLAYSERTGSLLWREPSRRFERDAPVSAALRAEIDRLAFAGDTEALREALVAELHGLEASAMVSEPIKVLARTYLFKLET